MSTTESVDQKTTTTSDPAITNVNLHPKAIVQNIVNTITTHHDQSIRDDLLYSTQDIVESFLSAELSKYLGLSAFEQEWIKTEVSKILTPSNIQAAWRYITQSIYSCFTCCCKRNKTT